MAKRITAFAAADGTLFTDPSACANYEKTTLLAVGVGAALAALGAAENTIVIVGASAPVSLQDFLIHNSEVLVEALTPAKAPRQPRQSKEKSVTDPVVVNNTIVEAGTGAAAGSAVVGTDIAPIVIKEEPVVAPEVTVKDADPVAGNTAEAELEALLGGGAGEVAL